MPTALLSFSLNAKVGTTIYWDKSTPEWLVPPPTTPGQ